MIIIAHRGNIDGSIPELENHPDYLISAVSLGFYVEVDVWKVGDDFYLGHDSPQYLVDKEFLLNRSFWHHAKNIKAMHALNTMKPNNLINCFYHDTDDCTLTSGGWIWTYPGKELTESSIAVMPERVGHWDNEDACDGICTDYPVRYRKLYPEID